jgi:UDP-N-acetylmuramoylalanine--D-glutamate ligase
MTSKIVILGAGKSGVGAAILGKKKGYDVFISEKKEIDENLKGFLNEQDIQWEAGKHSIEAMKSADFIIKSPGISSDSKIIKKLIHEGKDIISEIEFASRYTSAILIGITGTNGKTTTTMLTYKILKDAGFNVGIAGNIGDSFAFQVAKNDFDYYVLEISSFQLDDICEFAPHISVITNITPDHLDRYNYNFDKYIKSKLKILRNQSEKDFFLFNSEDPVLKKLIKRENLKPHQIPLDVRKDLEGVSINKDQIIIKHKKKKIMINSVQFSLSGRHNLLNAMAASTIGSLLDVSKESIRDSLCHFKGAPHRMEKVLTIQHVEYINDSKATNINATFFAIDSIKGPLVWIVGGVDKGNNYSELLSMVRKKAKAIICLGLDNEKLRNTFESVSEIFIETQSMSEAVKIAYKVSEAKDTVLLSPACASFDLFKNYEDRGNQFKNAVRNL